jgi:hypothetical protein
VLGGLKPYAPKVGTVKKRKNIADFQLPIADWLNVGAYMNLAPS